MFSLTYTNECISTALCTVNQTLNALNCTVFYGTDPSYQNFSNNKPGPINEWFNISELEDETDYFIDAVFTIHSNGVDILYHNRTNFTTGTSELLSCNAGFQLWEERKECLSRYKY